MNPLKEGKFVFGTVSWKACAQWYTVSMINTYRNIRVEGYPDPEYFFSGGLYVIASRNILVKQVLKYHQVYPEIEGIMWIDDDIQWYWNDLVNIMGVVEENPDAVVGMLYAGREGDMVVGKMKPAPPVIGSGKPYGAAEFLGFGFTYTPISCFAQRLETAGPEVLDGASEPWFFNSWQKSGDEVAVIGEDVYFCRAQEALGRKIIGIPQSTIRHAHEPGPRGLTSSLVSIGGTMIKTF